MYILQYISKEESTEGAARMHRSEWVSEQWANSERARPNLLHSMNKMILDYYRGLVLQM